MSRGAVEMRLPTRGGPAFVWAPKRRLTRRRTGRVGLSGSAVERDYIENPSILSDFAIILRTPRAVIRGDGAY